MATAIVLAVGYNDYDVGDYGSVTNMKLKQKLSMKINKDEFFCMSMFFFFFKLTSLRHM